MATTYPEFRTIHGMAGNVFPTVSSKADAAKYKLSDATVAEFRERGFIKGPRVLDQKQIDVLREGLERIRTGENPASRSCTKSTRLGKAAGTKRVSLPWRVRIDEAFTTSLSPANRGL